MSSAVIALLALLSSLCLPAQEGNPREMRGVWIPAGEREIFSSPAKMAAAMKLIADAGANAVFPPAWTAGSTSFPCAALRDATGAPAPERDLLAEILFEAHRVGLEVLPWFEPGIPCPSEAECALLKTRPELFVRGPDGKVVFERGVAAVSTAEAAGQDLVVAVVVEACRNYDLDGVVGVEPFARIRKEVTLLDPGLVVVGKAGSPAAEGEAAARLPDIDVRAADENGPRLITYGMLHEKDGELAQALRDEAWRTPALPPWRNGKPWRGPAEALDPAAGGGSWNWVEREGEPSSLALDGGESGDVAWAFQPREAGVYSLHVWIPFRDDLTSRASFRLASPSGARTSGIDLAQPKNRGWVRLGDVRLEAGAKTEVVRLAAEEEDATKITAAGPIVPLLNRRAMRR